MLFIFVLNTFIVFKPNLNMLYNLRLFSRLMFLLPVLLSFGLNAQNFSGERKQIIAPAELNKVLTHWEIYRLDPLQIKKYLNENGNSASLNLQIGEHDWRLYLEPSKVLSQHYTLQISTDEGVIVMPRTDYRAFRGTNLDHGGSVRLTLDQDFIHGYIMDGTERYYLEPLWYHQKDADRNLFLFYSEKDVIYDQGATCIELAAEEEGGHVPDVIGKTKDISSPELLACHELEIAIASDNSMFDKYGSVSAVELHNIAVINDVQGDYTGNFNHDIEFVIVTQFVVTGTDPWTTSTDAGQLLGSFRNWGNAGNFGVAFDNGELWTDRDFDGATVGIAYVGGICNTNKYHCLQDYTSNANLLRCMTSHELGHNFNSGHDLGAGVCPPNFIMCPFVNSSTEWSTQSTNVINSYMQTRINNGCLGPCSSGPPLVADFTWEPNPACVGQSVQFTDASSGNVTGRSWSFPGGSPPSSTQTNPVVTWGTPGTKNVTLTLTGGGGPASTMKQVIVNPVPTANFTYSYSGLTYTFTSSSTNASTYFWDFGDGLGSSLDPNPVYTYPQAGIYTITLTVENSCGTSTKTVLVNTVPTAEFSASPTSGCATLTVAFTNESSSNAGTFSWQFPGGQPATSNLTNPVVQYSTSGTYPVTLTAVNGSGSNSITKTGYITVQIIATSGFTYTINGQTVSFTNTSVGATSYLWNFGDGQTSTLASPSHTYATGGVYTVTLSSTNDCGTTTSTQTISLLAPPTASFTATPTSGCGPLTVQFTSTSGGSPTTYDWSFPGGTPDSSAAANPTVVYNTPGTYTVSLTVSNTLGSNTATQPGFITVNAGPTAGFTSSTNGATASFTNTSGNAVSYTWNFGDGQNATTQNPTHTYAADGTYTVTLTATNPCGTNTFTQNVTILTPPTAAFTATPLSGCGPLTVQFTSNSSANAVTYNWLFPGGNPASSSAQNPTVVYNTPGTYTVTLTVSNGAGSNTAAQQSYITVNPGPTAGFTSSVNGATVSFTNTSGNAVSYSWAFGDGQTSTAQNPTHTYAADGTFTVTLTATNPCGAATFTQTVVIVTPPTAAFIATPTSGCGPLTVQFTSNSSANTVTYNWSFPGGNPANSSVQNPTVVYNTPGTYAVTLIVGNAAGSDTTILANYITVNPGPTAGFTSSTNGATATFTNTSINSNTYSWNFGDGQTSTTQNPTHTYGSDGTYTVTLTATNACGTNTFTQTVTILTPPTAGFSASPISGCGPLTVQFTNGSSANATSYSWSFPGGTPASSTAQNPSVTYATPGNYSVTLTVSNGAGSNTSTQTNYITVNPGPTAGFTSSTSGATATFTNTSVNAATYSWDFGDNSSSTTQNPAHTYANDGTYTVTLTATGPCGIATFTQTVVIITSPNAGFTANTTIGCGPLTVQFQDLSSGNTTGWEWSFPGGSPTSSTVQNPVVTYNTPGTYTVTLVASTAAGSNTFTQQNFIVVQPLPIAGFTAGTNGGPTVTFTNTSQNAASYLWDFGDGSTGNTANPTHTYTADGTYTVTLTATNNCGSMTFTQTVTAVTIPQAAFTPSVTAGCFPLAVQFSNQSSANTTAFSWNFEGGTPETSTEANPSVTFNQPGVYQVTLTVSNTAGTATATSSITVNGLPSAGFTSQTAGLSIILTNTSGNADTYFWDFGDGSNSTQANPTHDYTFPGMYTVKLRAENACGSTEFSQTIEIVGSAPIAAFSASELKGCVPFSVQFSDQSAGNPTSWEWTFPGGTPTTSTAQNPSVTYSGTGNYSVTLVVTNAFGNNTTTQANYISVIDAPQAGFSYQTSQLTVQFNNLSLNADNYSWNFGDGSTSTEANPLHIYPAPGTYTAELTVSNACGAATLQQMITLSSGIGEVTWLEHFRLYPNPTGGIFTVEMNGDARDELEFVLYNAIGQLQKREIADFGTGELKRNFDFSQLPAGMYTLQIRSGASAMQVKVVIQR